MALVALLAGAFPGLPGFLVSVKLLSGAPAFLPGIYDYAWFVGFGVAFVVYLAFRKLAPAG